MNSLASLSFRGRAVEGTFFKAETDQCLLERAASLGVRGRDASVSGVVSSPTASSAVDMLPEVLAHYLPVDVHRPLTTKVHSHDYKVHQPQFAKSTGLYKELTRKTYVDTLTLGSSMNTGRSKWAGGTLESEPNTSIWSVGEAQRLMLLGADSDPHREQRLRFVNPPKPQPVVTIANTPLRLLPDPTPGRALFWGTIMAVWCGAASAKLLLHAFEVQNMSEIRPKMGPLVASVGSSVGSVFNPVKEWRANSSMGDAMESKFSRKLKATML